MKRTTKKAINLNKLKTGCSPCLEQVNKIRKKKNSEIQPKENKMFVSWIFDDKKFK